jgi:hypothetical protein
MRTVLPAAVTMIAYALSMLFVGSLTWMVAPPGASAVTALVISIGAALAMSVCAIMLLRVGASRGLAVAGLYLGIAIPLIVAIGAGWRLRGSIDKSNEFNEAVRHGPVVVVTRTKENASDPHPAAYQAVGIGATIALSGLAFVALIASARRIPARVEPAAVEVVSPPPPLPSMAAAPTPNAPES